MKLNFLRISVLACSLTVLSSCSKSTTEDISPVDTSDDSGDSEDPVAKVTYKANIKSIMDSSCTGCHSASEPKAGISLVTYSQVKNSAQNGTLINVMNGQAPVMPPKGKLAQTTLDLIDKWKADGFLEE